MNRHSLRLGWMVLFGLVLVLRAGGNEPDPAPDPAQKAVDELSAKSGVKIEQDGIGTPGGRDIDTRKMTPEEIRKVRAASKETGYAVENRADSTTIKSKDGKVIKEITAHHQDTFKDPVGSSAADARNISGDPESFRGKPDPKTGTIVVDAKGNVNPTVNDLLGKTGTDGKGRVLSDKHPLKMDPKQMTTDQIKDLGKVTKKVIDVGKVHNPQLQQQAEILHKTGDPAKAGIKDLNEFQRQAQQAAAEGVRNENRIIQSERAQLESEFKKAKSNFDKAKASGNPNEIAKARTQFENVKSRAIQYDSHVNGAQQKAINRGAGDVYAEANGFTRTTTPDGKTRYVNKSTGETFTQSQMAENITRGKNINLRSPPTEPGVTPPGAGAPVSKGTKIGGGIVFLYGAYHGAQQGAELAVQEEKPGDSSFKTIAKATVYGTVNTLGIVRADEIGEDTAKEVVRQWAADVKAGKIPATGAAGTMWKLIYAGKAGLLAGGRQTKELVEGIFINPLIQAGEAIDEAVGVELDKQAKEANEKKAGDMNRRVQDKKDQEKAKHGGWENPGPKDDWDRINKIQGDGDKPPKDTGSEVPVIDPPKPNGPVKAKPPSKVKTTGNGIDISVPDEDPDDIGADNGDDGSSDEQPVTPPPPVVPEPPTGGTVENKGFIKDKKGQIEVIETKDANGNVIKVTHVEYDPNGKVIDTKNYPVSAGADNPDGQPAALDPVDLAGTWTGTRTFTRVIMPDTITVDDPDSGKKTMTKQQCEGLLEVGKARTMILEFRPTGPNGGTAIVVEIFSKNENDGAPLHQDEDDECKPIPYVLNNNEVVLTSNNNGAASTISGKITREGSGFSMTGPILFNIPVDEGRQTVKVEGTFTVKKPAKNP